MSTSRHACPQRNEAVGGGLRLVRVLLAVCVVLAVSSAAHAAPVLTISTMPAPSASVAPPDGTNPPPPITWNILGLDSNKPTTDGPNTFLSGARVCNVGDATATNVTATFAFTSANTYINLVPGSPSVLSRASLAAGACTDFFFNILVTRDAAAFSTARRFVISATADGLGTVSTLSPRELFVEKLVSQNRNGTRSIVAGGGGDVQRVAADLHDGPGRHGDVYV